MYTIGYDIGSSSVKASILETRTNKVIGSAKYPSQEFKIISDRPGWAEQDPDLWWSAVCNATRMLMKETSIESSDIKAIGIAYQMHGLVLLDKEMAVLRPAIIWCDSRAVDIGEQSFKEIGEEKCLKHLLNSPGNFTASKLKWVKDNEPEIFSRIHKFMLPGDFINMKLTGEINTTISGLSEGIFWDFQSDDISKDLMAYFEFTRDLVPDISTSFSMQGTVSASASRDTGLHMGTPVTYRGGDQPNNAMALGVMEPGEVAATGGTSGVVYGVVDKPIYDRLGRVNCFAHVNHTKEEPRIGVLLCINGAGIQYSWLKHHIAKEGLDYKDLEQVIQSIPPGSDGLRIIPFGNGAERIIQNRNPGAQINNLHFNRHTRSHMIRAGLEGVAFAFVYGIDILKEIGMQVSKIRVGNDNLFQSETFSSIISNLSDCTLEIVNTNGAVGAARASSWISDSQPDQKNQTDLKVIKRYQPDSPGINYHSTYQLWKKDLEHLLSKNY